MNASEAGARPSCPPWCVNRHGRVSGEDDWTHTGMVSTVRNGLVVKLCSTVEPGAGAVDGPYVLVNDIEITLEQAKALGQALQEMADAARAVVPEQSRPG